MDSFKKILRALLVLICFIPLVGFGACGVMGIFTAAISFGPIPLVLGVAGLLVCALMYKLIQKYLLNNEKPNFWLAGCATLARLYLSSQ